MNLLAAPGIIGVCGSAVPPRELAGVAAGLSPALRGRS